MTQQITLEINKKILWHMPGSTITVYTDIEGTPLDHFWRKKLRDSAVDDCVSVQITKSNTKKLKDKPINQAKDSEETESKS